MQHVIMFIHEPFSFLYPHFSIFTTLVLHVCVMNTLLTHEGVSEHVARVHFRGTHEDRYRVSVCSEYKVCHYWQQLEVRGAPVG